MPPGCAGSDALVKLLLEGGGEALACPGSSVDSVAAGLTVEEFQDALSGLLGFRLVVKLPPLTRD